MEVEIVENRLKIEFRLRVGKLGSSSVRYEVGLFGRGENVARADGHFVHVFVERDSQKAAPIPGGIRTALESLVATL